MPALGALARDGRIGGDGTQITLMMSRYEDRRDPVAGCARWRACWRSRSSSRRSWAAACLTRTTITSPTVPPTCSITKGLFLLNNKQDYKEAAKKFDEVDRQNPYSDWARKALLMSAYAYYQAEEYDRLHQFGEALYRAASRQPRRRLCAISDRRLLLRSDPRRHRATRIGPTKAIDALKKWCANIRTANMPSAPRKKSTWRATSSPAKKWISAAST